MVKKVLIVVDMQNDFVTGSLANPDAQAIVKPMAEFIKNFDGDVFFTQDTHTEDYLETQEGKNLPVEHCIDGTKGWEIVDEIKKASPLSVAFEKRTFGSVHLGRFLEYDYGTRKDVEFYFCGVCTGICVISNALLVKAFVPQHKVCVIEDLCACVTPESHKNALEAMKMCQINVVNSSEV